ncbi:hypothetical protein PsorP6_003257 [Peronosclerospora sorghi]|uniref:Uncharacterized protein n=1 Tax=Peronosclerospora sorghi TaxID=230839 RepID=A0ACC0VME6_9STRA|nr:hypothetical protein PsorP6_003257 [Peronosclerospora sorghi]
MTLFADIDATTQKIHRLCSDATVDAAAVVYLMLSKTVGQCHLIGCHYRDLFKQILMECVMNTSAYGVLLQILSSPLEHVEEAEMFREATTEVERKRNSIFPVVMARSNAEVALQMNTYDETMSITVSAIAKDAVRPGDSMPQRCTRPGTPCILDARMGKKVDVPQYKNRRGCSHAGQLLDECHNNRHAINLCVHAANTHESFGQKSRLSAGQGHNRSYPPTQRPAQSEHCHRGQGLHVHQGPQLLESDTPNG